MGLIYPQTLMPESQTQLKYVTPQFAGTFCDDGTQLAINYTDACRTAKYYTAIKPTVATRNYKVEENLTRPCFIYKVAQSNIVFTKYNVTNVQ
jgi:hypothetical protein